MIPPISKKITSINEISDIVEKVLERMDEPDLKTKNVECRILNDQRFESYAFRMGVPAERLKMTMALTHIPQDNRFIITLREADFFSLFASYFHELAHIAIEELIQLKLTGERKKTYPEALAYSFEGYAREVYNSLEPLIEFGDTETIESRKNFLKEMIDMPERTFTHAHALSTIYGLLDRKCSSYEEVYKTLKAPIKKQH